MAWLVWNFGRTRSIPYKGRLIFFQKNSCMRVTDSKLLAELKKYGAFKIEIEKERAQEEKKE